MNYLEKARIVADKLQLDFTKLSYSLDDLARGIKVEEEHGTVDPATNVTDDDLILTAKIALAHLNELPDYYDRLYYVEHGSPLFWRTAPMLSSAIIIILIISIIVFVMLYINCDVYNVQSYEYTIL